jgi:hypothetical protein
MKKKTKLERVIALYRKVHRQEPSEELILKWCRRLGAFANYIGGMNNGL